MCTKHTKRTHVHGHVHPPTWALNGPSTGSAAQHAHACELSLTHAHTCACAHAHADAHAHSHTHVHTHTHTWALEGRSLGSAAQHCFAKLTYSGCMRFENVGRRWLYTTCRGQGGAGRGTRLCKPGSMQARARYVHGFLVRICVALCPCDTLPCLQA